MNKSLVITNDKESAAALNTLSREQQKQRLLADILIDINICRIEGWDYREYLLELKAIIDSILEKAK